MLNELGFAVVGVCRDCGKRMDLSAERSVKTAGMQAAVGCTVAAALRDGWCVLRRGDCADRDCAGTGVSALGKARNAQPRGAGAVFGGGSGIRSRYMARDVESAAGGCVNDRGGQLLDRAACTVARAGGAGFGVYAGVRCVRWVCRRGTERMFDGYFGGCRVDSIRPNKKK